MGEPTRFTNYTFDIFEGLPPKGETSFFVGFADDWTPYLLKWNDERSHFFAAGFQSFDAGGFMFRALVGEEVERTIKRYAALPAVLKALEESPDDG